MAKIVIQPDAAQLTALLRADSDEPAWLELRESIIQEFAKRHLKSLVNTDAVKRTLDDAQKAIVAMVQDEIGIVKDRYASRPVFEPSPKFKATLEQYVEQVARPRLEQLAREAMEQKVEPIVAAAVSHIVEMLPERIDRKVKLALDEEFKKRMDAAAAAFKVGG